VTVELGDSISPATAARVRALDQALTRDPPRGFREAVPTYRSLLVVFDPLVVRLRDVLAALERRAGEASNAAASAPICQTPNDSPTSALRSMGCMAASVRPRERKTKPQRRRCMSSPARWPGARSS